MTTTDHSLRLGGMMQNFTLDLFEPIDLANVSRTPGTAAGQTAPFTSAQVRLIQQTHSRLLSTHASIQNTPYSGAQVDLGLIGLVLELEASMSGHEDQKLVIKVRRLPRVTVAGIYD